MNALSHIPFTAVGTGPAATDQLPTDQLPTDQLPADQLALLRPSRGTMPRLFSEARP
jgi:hypothetical protein